MTTQIQEKDLGCSLQEETQNVSVTKKANFQLTFSVEIIGQTEQNKKRKPKEQDVDMYFQHVPGKRVGLPGNHYPYHGGGTQ